jgi:signal transduction histidine kinase
VKLHHRIVVPFVFIALAATSATAYVALLVTSRALRARVEAQILNAAALVSQSEFALNATILGSVKAIAGADVVTYTADGRVLVSTLAPDAPALAAALADPGATREALAATDAAPILRHAQCGAPCDIAYRRVAARPQTVVAVVASTAELMAATRAVTRTILVAASASLLVMVIVSQLVARRITAPLDELGRFARDVSTGDPGRRVAAGDDEVGRLGAAFNDMLGRLEQSQSALVRSEKLAVAGLVAARVAHDIRNPLSSIKMQTQLLRAALRPGAAGRHDVELQSGDMLDAVLRDISQVETVITDLLEVARPGVLNTQPVQLDSIVREVLQQLAPQLAHRRIHVDLRLDEGLPPVLLDADRFRQALFNVVNNAADAMPTGGTLLVATRRVEGDAAIALDVCDDGTGIAPDMLERVFDPFVSTKRDGVGLGLVNARAVVESHGGRIELAARSPKGTRATLSLPIPEQAHG